MTRFAFLVAAGRLASCAARDVATHNGVAATAQGPALTTEQVRDRLLDQGFNQVYDLFEEPDGSWRADAFVDGVRSSLKIDRTGRIVSGL
jgi:hypothetical protein